MPAFVAGNRYARVEIASAIGGPVSDEPYLIGRAAVALVAEVGGARDDEAFFPSRSAFRFMGPAPAQVVDGKTIVHLFVMRRGAGEAPTYLGAVQAYTWANRPAPHNVEFWLDPPLPREQWLTLLGDSLPPPGPPPETEIAALAADSGPHERWAALVSFLARWRRTPIASMPRWDGLQGLERVRETIGALYAIPDVFRQNHLVSPEGLAIEDGRIAFLYENQSVCLWATEPEGDDPRVWYRTNADGEPWLEEPERLSGFLIQAVLFEAIMSAPFGAHATALDAQTASAIVERLQPLAGGRWNWNGGRFYARGGALAFTMENPPGVDTWLGAATPLALTPFDDLVTEDWEHVGF
jgi:hypothetical protein